jgi:hypothetical protein
MKGDLFIFFNLYSGGWNPRSTRHCGHQWPIVPALGDYDGEIGEMIGEGNRSTRRKPASVPLCPAQTPHAARTRNRAAAVGRQRLTAWATARPKAILEKQVVRRELDPCGSNQVPTEGFCNHKKLTPRFDVREEFCDKLSKYELFKKHCACVEVTFSYSNW